ncbi:hypothetical protein FZI95_13490 [Mycobacterium sp. CBMA247]|nr:hypothetical protein [Mycolicibacterium sp. CBMA 329]MUL89325.1 hypothetical protein [Mycolicibacterium sp. CBMA 331]MUL99014.1 hypothetical protein [Mycolicibacterium sp. CBMA 334]MUM25688.1 hypothetical protein [Mycolicibacterium sp. CBMA 295]MUM38841.1 hypothetical protein [Mycolicibacterium sp. CBMA 247]MUM45389.1 hypothetical protein [Mycolicibacterium sp. CBMA 294]
MIAHDDYHARLVGRAADGRQFFITTPFSSRTSAEFVARYLFDADGALVDATIVPLGARPGTVALPGNVMQFPAQAEALEQLLNQIQPVSFENIEIAPFSITAHGQEFGLILQGPDPEYPDDDDWHWTVTVEPGDYMAFYSPWDSGDYDT